MGGADVWVGGGGGIGIGGDGRRKAGKCEERNIKHYEDTCIIICDFCDVPHNQENIEKYCVKKCKCCDEFHH